MTEEFTPDYSAPLIIGATGIEAIRQNIKMIILTFSCSIPLDRKFAHTGKFIDAPNPLTAARLVAELTDALERYEPRIRVESIEWKNSSTPADLRLGRLVPAVKFSLKEGIEI